MYPYDTAQKDYRRYTIARGKYIDPDHPGILKITRELNEKAENYLDFARLAYEHVAENFTIIPKEKGERFYFRIRPIDEILEKKAGNSGDLSSVFISLLRAKGIPARHLVGFTLDGEDHKRAEFYLERYGWIPVDVAYRSLNPENDYFGTISRDDALIIFSRDVWLPIKGRAKTRTVREMHTAWYFWRYKSDAPDHERSSDGVDDKFTLVIE